MPRQACTVCGSTELHPLVSVAGIPVHCNLLWRTRREAKSVPKGDIDLRSCSACGHVFNLTFDPSRMLYSQDYENSLHFSPRFQEYATSLAIHLVDRYDLHGKDIIEIGCGGGDFLALLCVLGGNRGYGFDPSCDETSADQATDSRIVLIQDFYSARYANYKADLICCRHVLEHIHDPVAFLTMVRCAIGDRPGTVVFFEVPNALFILRDLAIWDIIYEHCSYFSCSSLTCAFAAAGFDGCEVNESYEGQFLCIEARHTTNGRVSTCKPDDVTVRSHDALAFADRYRSKLETWRRRVEEWAGSGRRVVVWGAGSKGVTFLNTMSAYHKIEYVVDINPRKHGKYVVGAGQRIVAPEFLRDYRPDVIVVMNGIYEREIRRLCNDLELNAELVCA